MNVDEVTRQAMVSGEALTGLLAVRGLDGDAELLTAIRTFTAAHLRMVLAARSDDPGDDPPDPPVGLYL